MTNLEFFSFTPAALRALAATRQWQTSPADDQGNHVVLLAALLAEPESRAARLLAERGVSLAALLTRWPTLHQLPAYESSTSESSADHLHPSDLPELAGELPAAALSLELASALADLRDALAADAPLVELASEHLLLALLMVDGPVADYLAAQQLQLMTLREQLLRQVGYAADPLPLPLDPLPLDAATLDTPQLPTGRAMPALTSAGSPALWRLIDAAANRAREALRVLEDYTRFALDSVPLTDELKQMRHALAEALQVFPAEALLASRDTPGDVGTALATASEYTRSSLEAIVVANGKRLQESLRSLEEAAKVAHPEIARRLEQLRYRAYTLEAALRQPDSLLARRRQRLMALRLYVLLDAQADAAALAALVERLVEVGVGAIQLRDKRLDDRELLQRAHLVRRLTRHTPTLFVVNDRPDLALLSEADAVHVGQSELAVGDVRRLVGREMLIGVSTHALDEARAAVSEGADYLGVGPVFPSRTKQFGNFVGLELLRLVAAELTLPIVAIGGIDASNLRSVLQTGISRVAVSAAVAAAEDPGHAAGELLRHLTAYSAMLSGSPDTDTGLRPV